MEINNIKGHAAALGSNVMWGLMAPVSKTVMAGALVTPLLLSGFRMFGAAVLFWIASLFTPRERVSRTDLLLLAGAGMLGIVFNQGCYLFGVNLTSPGEAAIITTTMPLWVMFLAWMLLGEPITVRKAGGIAVGATGAIMLVHGAAGAEAGSAPMLGDLLVLCAQLSYALYLTLYRNFIRRYTVFTLMKWMFTFAALASAPLVLPEAARLNWHAMTSTDILGSVYVVVCGTFLAYICIMVGQKNLRPTMVGMYNYVQPIVAMGVGIALSMDSFTPAKAVAVALVFAGVFMVNTSKSRTPAPAK